jgi:hypothetical protein
LTTDPENKGSNTAIAAWREKIGKKKLLKIAIYSSECQNQKLVKIVQDNIIDEPLMPTKCLNHLTYNYDRKKFYSLP